MKSLHQVAVDDSIRIAMGDGKSLIIPCECVAAIDAVIRRTFFENEEFSLCEMEAEDACEYWYAQIGNETGVGDTPWQAVMHLASQVVDSE